MNDLLTVIFVERLFGDRTICEITATFIPKKNHSNALSAEKDFANLERWLFTKFFTWRMPLINVPLAGSLSIR